MSTKIEWTEATWNPTTGCTRISEGCEHCYIERTPPFRMAHRRFDGAQIGATTGVQLHASRLDQPLHWRKPRRVFVNSMSDLFHEDVPDNFIGSVFDTMALAERHTFQVLTKRPARARSLLKKWQEQGAYRAGAGASFRRHDMLWSEPSVWPLPNVWLGVSAESQRWADNRIPILLDTPAAVRWISAEPLLGPIDLRGAWIPNKPMPLTTDDMVGMLRWDDSTRVDWVVAGGESGPGSRPMKPEWAQSLRDQCAAAGVSFFFKQWGDHVTFDQMNDAAHHAWDLHHGSDQHSASVQWRMGKKLAGRELDGRTHDEYPAVVS